MSDKWEVNVKGKPNSNCWEISVVLSTNEHGKRSYGWMGDDKVYIAGDGGPCGHYIGETLFLLHMATATSVCTELNA